ncbi:CCDC34 family protein [Campylobacter sp. JMF_01 NE2]|uniref:hypothetical protein n=1 Tax=unclassified Campylobacter TaxID=2593542 RepID=UPI0022E9E47F|nr:MULTISPECIES: hypothetical protein [unclassified Campylobacter]MDA3052796.1 CCDC34 family protein [Campylobacter sp. JMF_03 NE3]MDA3067127.1 CCDC34 family protein [Campylobacter sp. JMF_01 NE2]
MENEKIMREKAEQMTKKAEMKIQQAKEKEVKYQQWLKNKKQTDPNFRDYDENPLIIQSYEEFFVLTLLVSSFIFAGIFSGILEELRWREVPQELLWLSLIPVSYIVIVAILQKFKFKNHKIKFTNHHIEFYDYGKLKRKCKISNDELARPFFAQCTINKSKSDILFDLFIIFLIILSFLSTGILKTMYFLLSFYFSNLILKFFAFVFISKNLNGFKIFPFIQIAMPHYTVPMYGALLSARYYLIYLYNDEIYKEVKKYFLQKDINIDNLPKSYNIL